MNLDEQLRAALDREAEMQKGPAPDVDRLRVLLRDFVVCVLTVA